MFCASRQTIERLSENAAHLSLRGVFPSIRTELLW